MSLKPNPKNIPTLYSSLGDEMLVLLDEAENIGMDMTPLFTKLNVKIYTNDINNIANNIILEWYLETLNALPDIYYKKFKSLAVQFKTLIDIIAKKQNLKNPTSEFKDRLSGHILFSLLVKPSLAHNFKHVEHRSFTISHSPTNGYTTYDFFTKSLDPWYFGKNTYMLTVDEAIKLYETEAITVKTKIRHYTKPASYYTAILYNHYNIGLREHLEIHENNIEI